MKSQRKQKRNPIRHQRRLVTASLGLAGVVVAALVLYGRAPWHHGTTGPAHAKTSENGTVRFTNAHRQAAEFISYDHSIVLTTEQQQVMDEALSSIPAPCCAQYSIATCCCPCNLAKSTWGLSKFLIANQHANVSQVRAAASDWLQFSNPNGYTGDACFTKGCNRSFDQNGCGGMDEKHIQ